MAESKKKLFDALSTTQQRVLEQVRDGRTYDAHVYGAAAAGAVGQTVRSLVERRLLVEEATTQQYAITALGRITLEVIRKAARRSK